MTIFRCVKTVAGINKIEKYFRLITQELFLLNEVEMPLEDTLINARDIVCKVRIFLGSSVSIS